MNGKIVMKQHCPKKKPFFTVISIWKILLMKITMSQKEFVKILKTKNLREHYDLYVQDDTLLLTHVCGNFRNMS